MLGMPLIQTKPFKEISLREETPEVKTNRSIINARRNHRGWTLVLEKKNRFQTEVEKDEGKA